MKKRMISRTAAGILSGISLGVSMIGAVPHIAYAEDAEATEAAEATEDIEDVLFYTEGEIEDGESSIEYVSDGLSFNIDYTGKGEGYSSKLYDNRNGLPTSEANAIVQTVEGFIWIGSYSGLIRYDGENFERITSEEGLTSVKTLFCDNFNRLWIGTNDSGAAMMENGEYTVYNKNSGLMSLSVNAIAEDADHNIYLGTTQGMAVIGQYGLLHMLDDERINNEYILSIKSSYGGYVYGLTRDGCVFSMYDREIVGFYDTADLGFSDAHCIYPDYANEGYMYIGDAHSRIYHGTFEEGIFVVDNTYDVSPLSYINSIYSYHDVLWVCADNGIGFLYNNKFVKLSNLPMSTAIEAMMADYLGNLWFASSQQGVMKIVSNRFTDLFDKYSIDDEVVYTTCYYRGNLWIGTKTKGLMIMRNGELIDKFPVKYEVSDEESLDVDLLEILKECRVRSIVCDSKDRVWLSTFGDYGLICYSEGVIKAYTESNGLPTNRVRTVFECDDGSYAVACTGGLVIIKDDKVQSVYSEEDGIINTEILTVAQAGNGDLVVGTDGGGIYIISGSEEITHIGVDEGLSSDVVMRIKKGVSQDVLWYVTSNAIGYLETDYSIHTIHGFPYANNFDLYETPKADMWVISSDGIYVAKVEDLMSGGEIDTVHFGIDDGLPCIATSNSYSEFTDEGILYMAGTTGIAKVDTQSEFLNIWTINVAVPYIDVDGKRVYADEFGNFMLDSSANKIVVYPYVFNYSLINPELSYYLKGFETDVTTVKGSDLTPITYTNLKGGDYYFCMEIKDQLGEDTAVFTLYIEKAKSLAEMWWFRILITILIIAVIVAAVLLYIRYRTRKFIKKEKEQRELIREIVEAFAKVIDMKDKYTNGHSSRVAKYTAMLTEELGYGEEIVEKYYNIALLHDIGKIGVPMEILNKNGRLTDEEYEIIKSHSAMGYNVLKDISIMPELAVGAGSHHERPDGKGYPRGLKEGEIPRVAQIIAVADTFDAMYSNRPYRRRMNFDKVVSIMQEVKGTQLTADVVDAFLRLVKKGEFKDPNDKGDGSTEDIDNLHKRLESEEDNK